MIRDRLVIGIRDSTLSELLQMDAELTLDSMKKIIRQREAVHEQQALLKNDFKEKKTLEYIQRSQDHKEAKKQQNRFLRRPKSTAANKCTRCGKGAHPRNQCLAKDVICHSCKKKGHYKSQCFTARTIGDVTAANGQPQENSEEYNDFAYLDAVLSKQTNAWTKTIRVQGKKVHFKMDTGAEVTAISRKTWEELNVGQLDTSNKVLCGSDRKALDVLGQVTCTLTHKGKSCQQPVYVMAQLQHNLLCLPAIQALQLLAQADSMGEKSIPEQYPVLFNGLGTFPNEYEIKLKPDAKPFALFTPRNVPLPMLKRVQTELQRREALGVIAKVNEPTEWCAGMVVVPKKSGAIRFCVDFRPLNESVLREVHPLPKVEDTLAKLTGATIFSKLDANSGFRQVPLGKNSCHLTTFITPFWEIPVQQATFWDQ